MRTIKFRIWDRLEKEFLIGCSGYLWFNIFNENIGYKDFSYSDTKPRDYQIGLDEDDKIVSRMIIQQFTGITDLKGRPIYEGDIIKAEWKTKNNFIIGEIKYGSGGFYINKYDYLWFGVKNDVYEDGEVIGNVFENADLLKKL